ncbi:hypothetical protein CEXT_181481 [Caerostris extrusa]|uniref:Uncharacterized protein n=1 Tax=Caerostris extrusa TaxID=172846 RepID=A0AAV4RIT7_CAEEX|nr:hypothetical protein CEXT_181481 [Caerostris extrusa]
MVKIPSVLSKDVTVSGFGSFGQQVSAGELPGYEPMFVSLFFVFSVDHNGVVNDLDINILGFELTDVEHHFELVVQVQHLRLARRIDVDSGSRVEAGILHTLRAATNGRSVGHRYGKDNPKCSTIRETREVTSLTATFPAKLNNPK